MTESKVLVIDGDPKNLQILKESLESARFVVTTAASGEEGWQTAQGFRPDVIVSEVDMPDIDGFELLKRMQGEPGLESTPLIFLTNRRNLEDRIKSLRTGVKDYMIKPLHVKEVIARIQMILRRTEKVRSEESETARKLVGRLEDQSVEQLLENYGVEKRTGILALYGTFDRSGEIFFQNGAIVNARLGNFRAEKAVYQMLPWDSGHYIMTFKDVNVKPEIAVSNLGLLLQGFKRIQHREQLLNQLPGIDAVLVKTNLFKQILEKKRIGSEALKFISLFDGAKTLGEIFAESIYDDIKTLERTVRLYEQGFVASITANGENILNAPQKWAPPSRLDKSRLERPSKKVLEEPEPKTEKIESKFECLPFDPLAPVSGEQNDCNISLPEEREDFEKTEKTEHTPVAGSSPAQFKSLSEGLNSVHKKENEFRLPSTVHFGLNKAEDNGIPQKPTNGNHYANGKEEKDKLPFDMTRQDDSLFANLLAGRNVKFGRFAVVSSNYRCRQQFISTITDGRFASKSIGYDGTMIEIGNIQVNNSQNVEIIGLSGEQRFAHMLDSISESLLGYVVLLKGDEPAGLRYASYLINSLKKKINSPYIVAFVRTPDVRKVPLDFVRYSLQLDEEEQLLEIDAADKKSLSYLLEQYKKPNYLKKDKDVEVSRSQSSPVSFKSL